VVMNGVRYIGVLKEKKEAISLVGAMQVNNEIVGRAELASYLRMQNMGTLETITFAGTGIAYSVSEFTDIEQMELDMLTIAMKQAKKTAVAGTENTVFDGILGKP